MRMKTQSLREFNDEIFQSARPVALTLIVQNLRCTHCGSKYRAPGDEPLVQLRAERGSNITRHVRMSKYPYYLPDDLERRVIEVEGDVSCCEACFERGAPRQHEMFPFERDGVVVPLPFNGKAVLIDRKNQAKPKPKKKIATLDDF